MKSRITAISRQGLLATAQRNLPPHALAPVRQAVLVVLGSSSIAVAISLLVHASLGLAPYDVLISAVSVHTGLGMSLAALVVTSTFFAIAWSLGRPPSLVSLGFMVSVSAALSVTIGAIGDFQPLTLRILAVPVAVALFGLGIAVVVQATESGGAFELLMAAGQDRGINPTLVRSVLELSTLALGILAGGSFGIATVIIAVALAPTLRFWMSHTTHLIPANHKAHEIAASGIES
ncbi:MAG: hypothetical protein ACC652_15945 [Acidimicrobiales bacterium]